MQALPQAFGALASYAQWVLWIAVPDRARPGKVKKFVIDPRTGAVVDAHDPQYWHRFDQALTLHAQGVGNGVGFVLSEQDPFFLLDMDDQLQPDGSWSPLVGTMCQMFQGAACEISNSGNGLHILGQCGQLKHGTRNQALKMELYTKKRLIALTGKQAVGDAGAQFDLSQFVQQYFPPREVDLAEWTEGPCPEWRGPVDDNELLQKALSSTGGAGSVFGDKATFAQLWGADPEALGRAFPPSNSTDAFGHSEADAALCSHLAFWTGKDCARIDRLFRMSALYRDKWDREDYSHGTILLSCSGGEVYTGGSREERLLPGAPIEAQQQQAPAAAQTVAVPGVAGAESVLMTRDLFLQATEQAEYFKGCVYVERDHAVCVPGGRLLDQGRFKARYGGFVFCLDAMGDKTTRNAWDAFTESITWRHPKVDRTCFRPQEAPGAVLNLQGSTAVNVYHPVEVPRMAGDPSLFIQHVNKLLPHGNDARIVLNYMAAMVQNPGQKFQWCPVIQGPEGNGKTIMIEALACAVGDRYTHTPNAQDLGGNGSKFTKWLINNLFIGVEEIYCAERREVMEMLKPLITNKRVEVQAKGVDQDTTNDSCANWFMCTNHKDAIPVTVDSRRYCILYCAQQSKADMERDGMNAAYFKRLWDWLKHEDGFAIVAEYLHTVQIEKQFDPSEKGDAVARAPESTSTGEAISLSLGVVEQEVVEAAAQGRRGFCEPWVSSMALDVLLKEIRRPLANNKRPEMLASLGYVPHPALPRGRCNNATATDSGKPVLYIKAGHIHANLQTAAEVVKHYDQAQNVLPSTAETVFNQK